MKNTKRIISLLGVAVIAGTLASCDANRNTKAPTGNLNLNATYASLESQSNISVSVNEMYNQFRMNGYSTVLNKIKNSLLDDYIKKNNINYSNSKFTDEFDKYLLNAIFSVSTVEDYLDLEDDDKDVAVQKFIDNQLTSNGINISSNKNELYPTYDETNDVLVYHWGNITDLMSTYAYTLAKIEYAKENIEYIRNYEYLYDVDGNKVENTYYLPKDGSGDSKDSVLDARKNIYSSIQNLTTTKDILDGRNPYNEESDAKTVNQAIVIKFASKAQAEKYINLVEKKVHYSLNKDGITQAEVKKFYIELFNAYYKTKYIDTEGLDECEYTTFRSDDENDEMTDEIGSTAVTFMTKNMVDEDSTDENEKYYLSEPFNISGDNIYYMCYRGHIYEGDDWDNLSDEQKSRLNSTYIDDKIVENWATETYGNTLIEAILSDTGYTLAADSKRSVLDLKIFDPIYENQYYNSYSDSYDFASKSSFDNSLVFTLNYTDNTVGTLSTSYSYSVSDSYDELNSKYGVSKATSLLATKYLTKTILLDKIDSDTVSGYKDGLKSAIKSFKKNDTSYSKKMGLSNYLVLQYGFDNQDDIVNYNLMASDLTSAFNSYYGAFWKADDYVTTSDSLKNEAIKYQIGENLLKFNDVNGLMATFKTFADKKYNNYYSLDISHILISVDYDHDGTNDDPKDFYSDLSEADKVIFRKDILTLADAIVKEAAIINTKTKVEALQFIAKTFNNPGYDYTLQCADYKNKKWSEFTKNFEFALRAEDLNTIDYSNGSNYVEEFTDAVKDLYSKIISENYKDVKENLSDYGYWNYEPYTYKDDNKKEHTVEATANNKIDVNAADLSLLTETTYGWHMLYAYDITNQTTCKFESSNDSSLSTNVTNSDGKIMYSYKEGDTTKICTEDFYNDNKTNDSYSDWKKLASVKTWEYQDIIVYKNDVDTTSDDDVVYVSGYSSDEKASIEQIFIYFMEMTNNGSVTSMRSTTTTAVKNVLADVMSRYSNSTFQTYRLYKQIGNIVWNNVEGSSVTASSQQARYNEVFAIQERTIDSYETLEESDVFYGWFDAKKADGTSAWILDELKIN